MFERKIVKDFSGFLKTVVRPVIAIVVDRCNFL